MINWRAAMITAIVELGMIAGGRAALMPAMWGWPDDFPLAGECFGRNCTATPARLVLFDIPSTPLEGVINRVGIARSELCPAAARVDHRPRLLKAAANLPDRASWNACLRIDRSGRIEQVGRISDTRSISRADAQRFLGSFRFLPATTAGRPTATWISLQVRASEPAEAFATE